MLIRAHQRLKTLFRKTGLSDDVLHVHLGLLIFFGTALFVEGGIGSPIPLVVTIVIELANEIFDRLRKGTWRWHETIPDLCHTLIWPAAIYAAVSLMDRT